MSQGQQSLQRASTEAIWDPFERATRLYIKSFDDWQNLGAPDRFAVGSYAVLLRSAVQRYRNKYVN